MVIDIQLATELIGSYNVDEVVGIIGNNRKATIDLKNSNVHTEHARLYREHNNLMITPCSRERVVYVNARKIESTCILNENDIINIGPFSLIVQADTVEEKTYRDDVALQDDFSDREIEIQRVVLPFDAEDKQKRPEHETLPPTPAIVQHVTEPAEKTNDLQPEIKTLQNATYEDKRRFTQKRVFFSLAACIVVCIGIVFTGKVFLSKKPVDTAQILTDASEMVLEGKFEDARKLLEKNTGIEARELLKEVTRKIRIESVVTRARTALDSNNRGTYDESMLELSNAIMELNTLGVEPTGQMHIRRLLKDIEEKKATR